MTAQQILDRLFRVMDAKGLAPHKVEKMCGVKAGTLYHWKEQYRRPRLDTLILAAQAVGLDVVIQKANLHSVVGDTDEARLLTAEEALTWYGHGWEEVWFEEDEETLDCRMLFECVFIDGRILCVDGDIGEINPGTYNRPYHSRLWAGDMPPTDGQREAAKWEVEKDG